MSTTATVDTTKPDSKCYSFGTKEKAYASLYGALATAIAAFLIFCPVTFGLTRFLGTATANASVAGGYAPTWVGWLVHVVVAALVAYGLTLLFMKPWKAPEEVCPVA